ncbi:hypothetical protein A5634_22005 [Mycobacterium asiaticum]|uniref:DUF3298 domain-containing protein n=1 Tax=Mycobacterium asiaticum TaxID=1790 RepID=A0A1A3P109_MYCAS|nr:esterase [Mycobacterium asiaticum]OBK27866.1 hypothetical protein A5634_22005 [Mycobacterium asiaticum]
MRYLRAAATSAAVFAAGILLGWPAGIAEAAPASCASLGGAMEAAQMCHIHQSGPTYTLDMTFPVDYPDQQALTDYVTQNRDGFVNVAQGSGRRDQPYQMDATSDQHSSGQPPRTRSVVLKFFQDLGGARPSNWYKAFNYNLATKQPITFDNLFAPNTNPLDAIYPIVQRELEHQSGLGVAISPGAGHDPTNYQNFAITDDALIFYFAQGELLPSFAGATQVQVPRNAIPPLAL